MGQQPVGSFINNILCACDKVMTRQPAPSPGFCTRWLNTRSTRRKPKLRLMRFWREGILISLNGTLTFSFAQYFTSTFLLLSSSLCGSASLICCPEKVTLVNCSTTGVLEEKLLRITDLSEILTSVIFARSLMVTF